MLHMVDAREKLGQPAREGSNTPLQSKIRYLRSINSKTVALAASLVWAASLIFPSITLYRGEYHGALILLLGWLSGSYAWFANLFIGYAFFRIIVSAKSAPLISIVIASLLSLDTFNLTSIITDEGGGRSYVYGYGLGAILWFVSICMYWVATALRVKEIDDLGPVASFAQRTFLAIGAILLTVTVSGSLIFGILDRDGANASERKRLENTAVKKGPVCKIENYQPSQPTYKLNGTLAVSGDGGDMGYYFWKSPLDFLDWGVSTVRVGDVDYAYANSNQNRIIVGVPAAGGVDARLVLDVLPHDSIDTKLFLGERLTPALHYYWTLDRETNIPCPDIDFNNSPRQKLLKSLELAEPLPDQREKEPRGKQTFIHKTIPDIEKGQAELVFDMAKSCPSDIEVLNDYNKRHPEATPLGAALKTPGHFDFFGQVKPGEVKYFCSSGTVYLVHSTQVGGSYGIQITKVALADRAILWNIFSILPYALSKEQPVGIRENEKRIDLALALSDKTDSARKHVYAVLHIDASVLKTSPESDLQSLVKRQAD